VVFHSIIVLVFRFSFFENRETQIYKNSVSDKSEARIFSLPSKIFVILYPQMPGSMFPCRNAVTDELIHLFQDKQAIRVEGG